MFYTRIAVTSHGSEASELVELGAHPGAVDFLQPGQNTARLYLRVRFVGRRGRLIDEEQNFGIIRRQ
jgi:hypothetical protein